MFTKILIANRGEIAVRVARTARRLGIRSIAVFSDADRGAPHVLACDEAVAIGPAPASQSYLAIEKIIHAAKTTGAEAIHPGYGFLSENEEFAEALDRAGVVFVGPTAETIRRMGSKSAAKNLMEAAGVPTTPGYQGEDQSLQTFLNEADRIGYPVLLKATAGGGGKGMRAVHEPSALEEALRSAQREAKSAFGDDRFLIEKYVTEARHLEVQIVGDGKGEVVHFFERDCSVQRRHQKIIEEAPAPDLPEDTRARLHQAGVEAGKAVDYRGAGTVEFLYNKAEDAFYFMEMNTRLQVEHPVTEEITGVDLVEWQLRVAAGEPLPKRQDEIRQRGHAFEARLYAEDPPKDFAPSIGQISTLRLPDSIARIDSGVAEGQAISPHYDPMIAKIVTHAKTRQVALARLAAALSETRVAGLQTNAAFLHALSTHPAFQDGDVSTKFIERHSERLFAHREAGPDELAALVLWMRAKETHASARGPWAALRGFRVNRPSRELFWIMHDGAAALLQCTWRKTGSVRAVLLANAAASALRDGREPREILQFEFSGDAAVDGAVTVLREDQRTSLFVAPHGEGARVWRGAHSTDIAFCDPLSGSSGEGIAEGSLTAPMPGVVTGLAVAEGDSVSAGATLMVMEAMKMEHSIKAPTAGVVKSFAFAAGDQVKEGDLLVVFEEDVSRAS